MLTIRASSELTRPQRKNQQGTNSDAVEFVRSSVPSGTSREGRGGERGRRIRDRCANATAALTTVARRLRNLQRSELLRPPPQRKPLWTSSLVRQSGLACRVHMRQMIHFTEETFPGPTHPVPVLIVKGDTPQLLPHKAPQFRGHLARGRELAPGARDKFRFDRVWKGWWTITRACGVRFHLLLFYPPLLTTRRRWCFSYRLRILAGHRRRGAASLPSTCLCYVELWISILMPPHQMLSSKGAGLRTFRAQGTPIAAVKLAKRNDVTKGRASKDAPQWSSCEVPRFPSRIKKKIAALQANAKAARTTLDPPRPTELSRHDIPLGILLAFFFCHGSDKPPVHLRETRLPERKTTLTAVVQIRDRNISRPLLGALPF